MKVHVLGYAMVLLAFTISCKKDDPVEPVTPDNNQLPIAKAGDDISLTLWSCNAKVKVDLDGSGSSDPDGSIVSYMWREIQGTGESRIRNIDTGKAIVTNMAQGSYLFVLTVKDSKGAFSSDTISVNITAPVRQQDLDLTFNSNFLFADNINKCYWDDPNDCPSDMIEISGKADFPSFGATTIQIAEYTDTASTSDVIKFSYFELFFGSKYDSYLSGRTNVNFKKLLRQGGGNFSGTFKIDHGSALDCIPDAYENAPPLHFSGWLDAATGTATLTIKGAVYL